MENSIEETEFTQNQDTASYAGILSELNDKDRLELEAQLLGFIKLPPTIREFVTDPYYLGNTYGNGKLYAYWLPVLEDIFPDAISTRYTNIVLTGCLGSGKSTISRLISLYLLCRLDHLKDFSFFKLAGGKNLVFSFFHTTTETVFNTFINPLDVIKEDSPYFTNGMLNRPSLDMVADTPRGKGPIGLDVLFYVFSEVIKLTPTLVTM